MSELSAKIHSEACEFIKRKNIIETLSKYGKVAFIGSFASDLMVWRDIDVQVKVEADKYTKFQHLTQMFTNLLKDKDIIKASYLNFENNVYNLRKKLQPGYAASIRFYDQKIKNVWKLDIWFLAKKEFNDNLRFTNEVNSRLNNELRKLIIDFKFRLKGKNERTPKLSGYQLYRAVLFKNLKNWEDVSKYLKENKVNLPENCFSPVN